MAQDVALALNILARDRASKTLDTVGNKVDGTGKKFGALRDSAKAGLAVAGVALVGFAKHAISTASDVNESQSKVNTVFGKSAKQIDAFAATAAKKLGQSKGDVLEAAGTFGNLFTALGLTQKAAAGMSTSAVQLATDLGSFNNASAPEALEAIRSGLLGEAEPLKKFGVNLSQARIEAEAFALGLVKPVRNAAAITAANNKITVAVGKLAEAQKKHGKGSIEAKTAQDALTRAQDALSKATEGSVPPLTAAQKAQAAYSVILKDTKTAQGDFARTSDGLANQQKILKAQFKDVSGELGAKLLPVMVKVVATGSKMVDWISKNHKVIVPLVAVIGTIIAAVKIWTIAQAALNFVLTANPIGLVIVGLVALGVGLVAAWKSSQTFRDVVKGVFKSVGDAASHLWDKVLRPYFKFISNAWLTVAGVLVHGAAKAFGWMPGIGPNLKRAAEAFDTFKDKVNASLDGIKKDVSVNVKANFFGGSGGPGRVNAGLRAGGGPVTRGKPYIVGEVEPELFVPETSGRILNQRQMRAAGGGGGDIYVFNLPPSGDPLQHARQIETELTRLRRQRGTALAFT